MATRAASDAKKMPRERVLQVIQGVKKGLVAVSLAGFGLVMVLVSHHKVGVTARAVSPAPRPTLNQFFQQSTGQTVMPSPTVNSGSMTNVS